jgi:gamma-glutamyltranspeptidase
VLTAEDPAAFDSEWVAPLSTIYRGWTVYELPPNGQGIAALMMLNLLEQSPIGSYGHNSAAALHTLIEAKKQRPQGGLRHHGRLEPVAGPCAVHLERRRSRDEHSGRARSRTHYQAHVHWL